REALPSWSFVEREGTPDDEPGGAAVAARTARGSPSVPEPELSGCDRPDRWRSRLGSVPLVPRERSARRHFTRREVPRHQFLPECMDGREVLMREVTRAGGQFEGARPHRAQPQVDDLRFVDWGADPTDEHHVRALHLWKAR